MRWGFEKWREASCTANEIWDEKPLMVVDGGQKRREKGRERNRERESREKRTLKLKRSKWGERRYPDDGCGVRLNVFYWSQLKAFGRKSKSFADRRLAKPVNAPNHWCCHGTQRWIIKKETQRQIHPDGFKTFGTNREWLAVILTNFRGHYGDVVLGDWLSVQEFVGGNGALDGVNVKKTVQVTFPVNRVPTTDHIIQATSD